MVEEIIFIETDKIEPHKDNPRKNLGDLSELIESIQKNGIMQNLTVIADPESDSGAGPEKYICLIGHRRLEAAKKAGLKYVPAVVVDMDHRQQLSVMLEENMQRADLTVLEQAQGFQMMLDLGETEKSIAEKTGFSRQTIKNRVELAKLDPKKLEAAVTDKQITLTDLIELQKIKDVETRNKILDGADGHWDIVRGVNAELQREKEKAAMEKLEKAFDDMGIKKAKGNEIQPEWSFDIVKIASFNLGDLPKEIEVPERSQQRYWNKASYGGNVYVYTIKDKRAMEERKKENKERQKAQDRLKEQKDVLQSLSESIYEEIKAFVLRMIAGDFPIRQADQQKAWEEMFEIIESSFYGYSLENPELFYDGTDYEFEGDYSYMTIEPIYRAVALCVSICFDDNLWNWDGYYKQEKGARLLDLVSFLEKYGFTMKEEEKLEFMDGSHEAYTKGED